MVEWIVIIGVLGGIMIATFLAGLWYGGFRSEPVITRPWNWSIGLYAGASTAELKPFQSVLNPILTADDVTDVSAALVADPFMVQEDGIWYLFFEVWPKRGGRGEIGLAKSADCLTWDYQQIILREAFHLSYPLVFVSEGKHFMLPETGEAHSVRLYRAVDFPVEWRLESVLLGEGYHDATIFEFGGRWWMYASVLSYRLHLYWSDTLKGEWHEHPMSPVVEDNYRHIRPAGRVKIIDGRPVRFAQDPIPIYGSRVWAFEVTTLTPNNYEERPLFAEPILAGTGNGWNAKGMHHLDLHATNENEWIACVDGCSRQRTLLNGRDLRDWWSTLTQTTH